MNEGDIGKVVGNEGMKSKGRRRHEEKGHARGNKGNFLREGRVNCKSQREFNIKIKRKNIVIPLF